MDAEAEQKIIGMLDALAHGLAEFRADMSHFRGDFDSFRSEMYGFRAEMHTFRAETNANFNRLERRLDGHETRIERFEQR